VDESALQHQLTDEERAAFERDGFLLLPGVLSQEDLPDLIAAVDRVTADVRATQGIDPGRKVNELDVVGREPAFLPLLDHPKVLPKVWGILGWHIQLYHSHMIINPPLPAGFERPARLGWHQDSGRLNLELGPRPQPRVSLKAAWVFTDMSEPDRGNLTVIPGSHTWASLDLPEDETLDHPDAQPICANAGGVVLFDRRIFHAGNYNTSDITRKILFMGYSYRWLKPRDNMTVGHLMDQCDPIQQQLFGASVNGGFGYTSPADEDVPLKAWLSERLGEGALVE